MKREVPPDQVFDKFGEVLDRLDNFTRGVNASQPVQPDIRRLHQEAVAAAHEGRWERAEVALAEARSAALAARDRANVDLAQTEAAQGLFSLTQLDYRAALEYFAAASSHVPQGQEETRAFYLRQEGMIADELGLYERALSAFEQALQIEELLHGTSDPATAVARTWVATAYGRLGRLDEAEVLLRNSIRTFRALGPEGRADLARSLNTLGARLFDQRRYDEAKRLHRQALAIGVHSLGHGHKDVAVWLHNIASDYFQQGRFSPALRLMRRAVHIDLVTIGPRHPQTARHLDALGNMLSSTGEDEEGLALLRQSRDAAVATLGPESPVTLQRTCGALATLLIDAGRYADAEPMLLEAVAACDHAPSRRNFCEILCPNALGRLYLDKGNLLEAEPLLKRAVNACTAIFGAHNPDTAVILSNLGALFQKTGRLAEAQENLEKALDLLSKTPRGGTPRAWRVHLNYAELCCDQQRFAEALTHFEVALSLLRDFKRSNLAVRHIAAIETRKRDLQRLLTETANWTRQYKPMPIGQRNSTDKRRNRPSCHSIADLIFIQP